jgi:predicted nucleic acid-binding protein
VRYLLDINVISEWIKPRPDAGVVAWLAGADEDDLYLSVLAFAEIRLGTELLPEGPKRRRIGAWLDDDLAARFEGRIIGIDRAIAEATATRGRCLTAGGCVGSKRSASRRSGAYKCWRVRARSTICGHCGAIGSRR